MPTQNSAARFPQPIDSQVGKGRSTCNAFRYAVKVAVGFAATNQEPTQHIVAPGAYFTAINVSNPSNCKAVTFTWRLSMANRVGTIPGTTSYPRKETLRPGLSVEIDNPDMFSYLQQPFNKGFVIIDSPCELDIVAVYSCAPTTGAYPALKVGSVSAFHTERVPARIVRACDDDLDLDISTGVAEWELTLASDLNGSPLALSVPRAAAALDDSYRHPAWAPAQSGSKWLSVAPFANTPNLKTPGFVPGYYMFQTSFNLCAAFESAHVDLSILNDDAIQVWVNAWGPLSFGSNLGGPPTLMSLSSGLLPGKNTVTITVRNDDNSANPNPVGLNVKGNAVAVGGACSDCGCC